MATYLLKAPDRDMERWRAAATANEISFAAFVRGALELAVDDQAGRLAAYRAFNDEQHRESVKEVYELQQKDALSERGEEAEPTKPAPGVDGVDPAGKPRSERADPKPNPRVSKRGAKKAAPKKVTKNEPKPRTAMCEHRVPIGTFCKRCGR